MKMDKRNRSFLLYFKYTTNIIVKVQVDDSCFWHRRFGHFNTYSLKLLHEKNMMRDLPSIKENSEVFEGYLLGKQHLFLFSNRRNMKITVGYAFSLGQEFSLGRRRSKLQLHNQQ